MSHPQPCSKMGSSYAGYPLDAFISKNSEFPMDSFAVTVTAQT